MMYIYSYNEYSEGAKELAAALPAKRIRHENSAFRGASNRIVINWGMQNLPDEVLKCRVLNRPEAIRENSNKLSFFQTLGRKGEEVSVPEWTASQDTAKAWVADGVVVVARSSLNGHSGEGISFMELSKPESFVSAPLYTKYVKKKEEFRVHFCNRRIIDVQRKALRSGVANPNWRIRNLDNGFVFVRNNISVPTDVTRQAELYIQSTDLDFGALDLIWNEKDNKAYVLEVNCAPGLQGSTVDSYVTALKEMK